MTPIETRKKIVEDCENGLSVKELSERYNRHEETIRNILKRVHETGSVAPKKRDWSNIAPEVRAKLGRQMPMAVRKWIIKECKAGVQPNVISRTTGFSLSAVNGLIRRYLETKSYAPQKRFMSGEKFEMLRSVILKNPDITFDEARDKLGR